ncbi:unnamed protein product [Cuscuta europaea]|uniref:RNase H type-1 domain-containing protein n=1 Tax=Cuscuta europaea TaxID=41803 RepID=A0A9P1EN44_CUSEU|nr:unnamed protein product [Cuscuta europaea]
MTPKVTDSPVWRRICGIHSLAISFCDTSSSGALIWTPQDDGKFSFSSGYNMVRQDLPSSFSYKHAWHPRQSLQIKLFVWKVLKSILPFTNNLGRFNYVLNPSICPFCRTHEDDMNHILFSCSKIRPIWVYFMGIFGIPYENNIITIKQVYMAWWFKAGSMKLVDIFKHNLPGIISWHVWKVYTSITWGSETRIPSSDSLITTIKLYTQLWVRSFPNMKVRSISDILYEEHLIPNNFKIKRPTIQVIKWKKPQGKFKLNTDASYLPQKSAGGAILRNSTGEIVLALSFPIVASSCLEAELVSLILATVWTMEAGYSNLLVETDSTLALKYVVDGEQGRWGDAIQKMKILANRKGVSFSHVWRQGNWTAHFVAAQYPAQTQVVYRACDLPTQAKQAYYMDLFEIPSFRF